MAKKLSVQTVAATAKTLKKASSALSPDEERAIRMRTGVGLAAGDRLEQKTGPTDAVVAQLARLELLAFQAMGKKIYGLGQSAGGKAGVVASRSPKDKIIRALKRR